MWSAAAPVSRRCSWSPARGRRFGWAGVSVTGEVLSQFAPSSGGKRPSPRRPVASSLLCAISAADATTCVVIAAALAAVLLPARRAMRVDPMRSLRAE